MELPSCNVLPPLLRTFCCLSYYRSGKLARPLVIFPVSSRYFLVSPMSMVLIFPLFVPPGNPPSSFFHFFTPVSGNWFVFVCLHPPPHQGFSLPPFIGFGVGSGNDRSHCFLVLFPPSWRAFSPPPS